MHCEGNNKTEAKAMEIANWVTEDGKAIGPVVATKLFSYFCAKEGSSIVHL